MAKGKVVSKTKIKRKSGYLYYVDGNGNVREAKMRRGAKKGHKTCKKPAKKKASRKRVKRKATRRKRK